MAGSPPVDARGLGSQLVLPVGTRDHARGDADAAVTLVEYGDFECPQCTQAFPIVQRICAAFGPRLRFVYRHFPNTNVHPHAQHAAEASEWAATGDAFWQMHDALFSNGGRLGDNDILALAARLGLARAALSSAWAAHAFVPRVKEDFLSGIRSGVAGTPAFFVNGVLHEAGWNFDAVSDAIERALAAQPEGA